MADTYFEKLCVTETVVLTLGSLCEFLAIHINKEEMGQKIDIS